jgi:metallo-beta-lactamase family protein
MTGRLSVEISFLGATGTVSGSKYLFNDGEQKFLIDCGLFQGYKQLRLRNWHALPVKPRDIHSVVLTHAHIDHSGYLPLLVKNGFEGPIICSKATKELCGLLLPDSGHLQEEEARYANKRGFSKHKPALPLYTAEDAERALSSFRAIDYDAPIRLGTASTARLFPAGHILGASMVMVESGGKRILFTGDLGRPNDPVMRPPTKIEAADVLILESTYGDRRHDSADPEADLGVHLAKALGRGGVVVIPAFAVGRAQTLLHFIARLKARKAIPDVPVYLNSPMAVDATEIYHNFRAEHRLSMDACKAACTVAQFINTPEESKALNDKPGPMIIISASGMATGGRVVHHLKAFAPDPRNMILFAGFQAGGTRGAAMIGGAQTIRIHGEDIPVRAEVVNIGGLSAHADYAEIIEWLGGFRRPPRQTFLTHGEPAAADMLRQRIEHKLGWNVEVPDYLETRSVE